MLLIVNIQVSRVAEHEHCNSNISFDAIVIFIVYRSSLTPLSLSLSLSLRDFRHEKTKKKRGTYRGGQIDLQSHSVKFNYSDEE
jgi:hypothetical protein